MEDKVVYKYSASEMFINIVQVKCSVQMFSSKWLKAAPGFKRLARPFMEYAHVKQSFVKWSEQTGNFPTGPGLKFFR